MSLLDPPPLRSSDRADALYGRILHRGRRLRRERRAFLATATMSFLLLAAAVPIALTNDDSSQVATTDQPKRHRPALQTTTTNSTEPTPDTAVLPSTTLPPIPIVEGATATTARRTARATTNTTRRSAPATTAAPATTSKPATTTSTPATTTTVVPGSAPRSPCTPSTAVVADHPQVAFVRGGDIWTVAAQGGTSTGPVQLTHTPQVERSPTWSPNGAQLAFARDDGLFVMTATPDAAPTQLTSVSVADPAWSPDGGRIAFVRGGDIFTMQSGGGSWTLVLEETSALGSPTWSRDSCDLAATWNGRVIKFRSADGSGVSDVRGSSADPSWGQTRIALTQVIGSTREVFTVNPDGSAAKRVTVGGALTPTWSPDGVSLAFRAPTRDQPGLYRQNEDGSGLARLTDQAADSDPAW